MKKNAEIGKRIRQEAKEGESNYFVSTKLGRQLLGMEMIHAPKVGLESMAKIITLACAGTLANLGIYEVYLPHIPLLTPSADTLKNFIFELGVDVILLTGEEIKNKGLALLCDKDEDKNLAASFVKLLCWYNERKGIEILCFEIESAGNSSKDAAKVIHYSLKIFELSTGKNFMINGSTTDAGGGDVGSLLII